MNEIYEKYFDYGPAIGQEITIEYTLVAAAASADEETTGTITKANDDRLIIEQNSETGATITLSEKWGGLQVYSNGGRIGPVQHIAEH